jgi:hypothetical protein
LIQSLGPGERLEIRLRRPVAVEEMALWVDPEVSIVVRGEQKYLLCGSNGTRMLADIAVHADRQKNEVMEARVIHVTLEDVYLDLTGNEKK